MKKIFLLFFVLLLANAPGIFAQYKYACFKSATNKEVQLTVYFKNKKAIYIKYKGQKKSIPLIYSNTKQTPNIGGSPAFFWTETYLVKTGKKITGSYVFTNGGSFELTLTYISSNTKNKIPKMSFTIIESLAGENFSAYRDTPCF